MSLQIHSREAIGWGFRYCDLRSKINFAYADPPMPTHVSYLESTFSAGTYLQPTCNGLNDLVIAFSRAKGDSLTIRLVTYPNVWF
jgi:hypothetical protein